jgi:hypothetical protein
MKAVIFIFIIFAINLIYACDDSPSAECDAVQLEANELSQTEPYDCCSELCYCNCCNQVSVLSLIKVQNIYENYSTPIIYHSVQNLSDYSSSHWQPPKI